MTSRLALSVAPMMERTDRHFRYLMRLISPNARLYTEMITARALQHGDAERLLAFDAAEHPLAAQLGGNDPETLARAARRVAAAGYDEVNLNVGCPSSRVQAGDFGARLMLEPGRVADCVAAMREASGLPVTVKTRIGVDAFDQYEVLSDLTERVRLAGATAVIVHARKAWLSGLSPKQNREIPPLDYARVHRLQREFPELPIVINGGFTSEAQVMAQVGKVDGVMLGRAAYHDPMLVGRLDRALHGGRLPAPDGTALPTLEQLLWRYTAYMQREYERGTPLPVMSRHLVGLVANRPGARRWRSRLAEVGRAGVLPHGLLAGLMAVAASGSSMRAGTRYNARIAVQAAPAEETTR